MVNYILLTFYITAAYILFTMFMALSAEKVMQSAYWLIMMLVGVGVMFLLANSEIMFAFQISIYAGGIAVLLLFAVLLTQHEEYVFSSSITGFVKATWSQVIVFLVLLINLIALINSSIQSDKYLTAIDTDPRLGQLGGIKDLGDNSRLVYDDGVNAGAFEVTRNYAGYLWEGFGQVIPFLGLLLLAALLGSIKLVIREWELEEDLSDEMIANLQKYSEEVSS